MRHLVFVSHLVAATAIFVTTHLLLNLSLQCKECVRILLMLLRVIHHHALDVIDLLLLWTWGVQAAVALVAVEAVVLATASYAYCK